MAELPQTFHGSWKLERSEMFDEYLAKKGVPWIARKMMKMAGITKVFRVNEADPNSYFLDNMATIKTMKWGPFKLGEPFQAEGFDSKVHKITFSMEGEKLLEHHIRVEEKDDQGETYSYHLEGEYLVLELTAGGVTAKRYMKKLP